MQRQDTECDALFWRVTELYAALELTVQWLDQEGLSLLASYVLSRSYGNYSGLFVSDAGRAFPNWHFSLMDQGANSTGLLPNDRPQTLKLLASYPFDLGVTVGTFFTWQSGTPLNRFGVYDDPADFFWPVYLVPRGSAGRTPAIWDLNLRATYEVGWVPWSGRVIFDLLHVGSPRRAVVLEQFAFLQRDAQGNHVRPNANYGKALAYQPPMTGRLGLAIEFR